MSGRQCIVLCEQADEQMDACTVSMSPAHPQSRLAAQKRSMDQMDS